MQSWPGIKDEKAAFYQSDCIALFFFLSLLFFFPDFVAWTIDLWKVWQCASGVYECVCLSEYREGIGVNVSDLLGVIAVKKPDCPACVLTCRILSTSV